MYVSYYLVVVGRASGLLSEKGGYLAQSGS